MTTAYHSTIRLARGYQFIAEFNDVPEAPAILFDEPPPLGNGQGPNAAAMVGAAVGNCLAASLAYCLRKARVEIDGLTAHVTTRVERNERGRTRIAGIDVALEPETASSVAPGMQRCEQLFEDFCTVTQSIRNGIPVKVSVTPCHPSTLHSAASV